MSNCLQCNEPTTNPKFCSTSCAAKKNNYIPKRKRKENFCIKCEVKIPYATWERKTCDDCAKRRGNVGAKTLAESIDSNNGRANAYGLIRKRARKVALGHGWSECSNCGYDKHVEICHIKAIKDFSLEASIDEINAVSNLVALCPNCHWELDHGKMVLGVGIEPTLLSRPVMSERPTQ